jgi:hypothetical protein
LFFSYGHDANEWLVHRLKTDLEARGHSVWIDVSRIRVGDDWRRAITDGLLDADSVVSFLSSHSVRNPGVCLDELRIALCVKSGRIHTVLLESEESVAPPSSISDVQWLDMSDWAQRRIETPTGFDEWYEGRLSMLCASLESQEARAFAGEITELRSILRPRFSDTRERQLLASAYVGREWLLKELQDWRVSPASSPAFILLGGPGLGKSRFAVEQLHTNPHVLCAVFCEWSNDFSRDIKAVVRTLAFRLACRLPDYRRVLLNALTGDAETDLESLSDDDLFDALITYPLSQLIDGGRQRVLMLIDGLDELDDGGSNSLAMLLARHLSELPAWLGVVLTARPEGSVLPAFGSWSPRIVAPDDALHQLDIRRYLAINLRDRLQDQRGTVQLLDDLVTAIEGNFLYASLLVESAREPGFDLADMASRPRGLDAFYARTFERRFPVASDYPATRDLLEILVAVNPCPVFLLDWVAGDDRYAVQQLTRDMGSLLLRGEQVTPGSAGALATLAFCHKSLADWLTDSERAGRWYVDGASGMRRCARAIRDRLEQQGDSLVEPTTTQSHDPELAYCRQRVAASLADAGLWHELQAFLVRPETPLWPYWRILGRLLDEGLADDVLDYLWSHPDRNDFFRRLQRVGDRTVTIDTIDHLSTRSRGGSPDLELTGIYVDAVHLSGRYRDAVALCDDVLRDREEAQVLGSAPLLNLAVRRLHHSMFFAPVDPLLEAAAKLHKGCDPQAFPDLYNELLFLLGGNLGVLSGQFVQASRWVQESLEFARRRDSKDFEIRSMRKHIDLLSQHGQHQRAYDLVRSMVSPEAQIESRYHMYLLGSLGEVCRHMGRKAEASASFQSLRRHASTRGVPGWHAHALLGLAALSVDVGQAEDAMVYLTGADRIYRTIGQRWGRIAAAVVGAGLEGLPDGFLEDEQAMRLARHLNYRYEAETLAQLATGQSKVDQFHLLFL